MLNGPVDIQYCLQAVLSTASYCSIAVTASLQECAWEVFGEAVRTTAEAVLTTAEAVCTTAEAVPTTAEAVCNIAEASHSTLEAKGGAVCTTAEQHTTLLKHL